MKLRTLAQALALTGVRATWDKHVNLISGALALCYESKYPRREARKGARAVAERRGVQRQKGRSLGNRVARLQSAALRAKCHSADRSLSGSSALQGRRPKRLWFGRNPIPAVDLRYIIRRAWHEPETEAPTERSTRYKPCGKAPQRASGPRRASMLPPSGAKRERMKGRMVRCTPDASECMLTESPSRGLSGTEIRRPQLKERDCRVGLEQLASERSNEPASVQLGRGTGLSKSATLSPKTVSDGRPDQAYQVGCACMARGKGDESLPTLGESGSDSYHSALLCPDLTMAGLEWTDSLPDHGLDLAELHRFAAEAAILAGSYLRDSALARTTAGGASTTLHDSIQIKENAADIVTKADMHAEELISGMIRERYPGHKSVSGRLCSGQGEAKLTRKGKQDHRRGELLCRAGQALPPRRCQSAASRRT